MERKGASTRKRKTRQLEAVLQAVHNEPDFLPAAGVLIKLRSAGATIGLATVYHNLTFLTAEGVLDQLHAADGTMLYRKYDGIHHHHHLVCRKYGRTEEFSLEGLEVTLDELANKHGFTEVGHVMEPNGVCVGYRQDPDSTETSWFSQQCLANFRGNRQLKNHRLPILETNDWHGFLPNPSRAVDQLT